MHPIPKTLASALTLLLLGAQESDAPDLRGWDRASIRRRLASLKARRSGPIELPTAMCYAPKPPPPEQADYVCPACGQRTVYAWRPGKKDPGQCWIVELIGTGQLVGMRAQAADIRGMRVCLDETSLCAHCSPAGVEPALGLIVRLEDGTEIRTRNIGPADLNLLSAFSRSPWGEIRADEAGFNLHNVSRLRTLLGFP